MKSIIMDDDHEFHMMQLADSFFPSGIFGLSGGLETLVKSGKIKDAEDVMWLVRQQLKLQIIPLDAVVLSSVMDAAGRGDIELAVEADNRYYSIKLVSEVRTASTRSGRQLVRTILSLKNNGFARKFKDKIDKGESPGTYPAGLAIAAWALKIPKRSAVRMMLYSYCVGMIGSAVRLGIISHIEGQKILYRLADDANSFDPDMRLDEVWQLNPIAEILQMQHEHDEFRMFIT